MWLACFSEDHVLLQTSVCTANPFFCLQCHRAHSFLADNLPLNRHAGG